MTQLLVSVRTVAEARLAIAGGAALIDVKEPNHGSLGRASEETIKSVVKLASPALMVSAAFGELLDEDIVCITGLRYAKWGLAGCAAKSDWRDRILLARSRFRRMGARTDVVAVAYADCRRAAAPLPQEVCEFACVQGFKAFLLDTWRKDGTTLLDWLSAGAIGRMVKQCREAGVKTALAGRLGLKEIVRLRNLEPEWFAVRGAVCRRGIREEAIDGTAVRALVDRLCGDSEHLRAEVDGSHGYPCSRVRKKRIDKPLGTRLSP